MAYAPTVAGWYKSILNRMPDVEGLDYWQGILESQGEATAYQEFMKAANVEKGIPSPPTWQDAYANFDAGHKAQFGIGIDRPWSSDADSKAAKEQIDQAYKNDLHSYNLKYGTKLSPDASVLGTGAQPNTFTPKSGGGGIFDQISKAIGADSSSGLIGGIGNTIGSNPILKTAATMAGAYFGGPIGAGLANAAATRGTGETIENSLASGLGAGALTYAGGELFGNTGATGIGTGQLDIGGIAIPGFGLDAGAGAAGAAIASEQAAVNTLVAQGYSPSAAWEVVNASSGLPGAGAGLVGAAGAAGAGAAAGAAGAGTTAAASGAGAAGAAGAGAGLAGTVGAGLAGVGAGLAPYIPSIIGAGTAIAGINATNAATSAQTDAATKAAELQNSATNRAIDLQREQWLAQQAAQKPYQDAGKNALAQMIATPGISTNNNLLIARRYMEQNPDVRAAYDRGDFGNKTLEEAAQFHYDKFGKGERRQLVTSAEATMGPGFNATGAPGVSPVSGFKFDPKGVQTQNQAFKFDASKVATDPGYAFRLSEGLKGLDRTAAARGGLISGSALKAATRYGQEMGSQEYQSAYNRAYGSQRDTYDTGIRANDTNYGRAYTTQQDAYTTGVAANNTNYGRYVDKFNADTQQNNTLYGRGRDQIADQNTNYNRLAALAGVGQTANTAVGAAGQSYANNTGNMLTSNATNAGNFGMQGASAYGAGQIGNANTIGNALNSAYSAYSNQQNFDAWLARQQP